jgi:hypothetical protein
VRDVKAQLAAPTGVPTRSQRLLHNGRELQDAEALRSLGLPDGAVVHMVSRPVPAAAAPPPPPPHHHHAHAHAHAHGHAHVHGAPGVAAAGGVHLALPPELMAMLEQAHPGGVAAMLGAFTAGGGLPGGAPGIWAPLNLGAAPGGGPMHPPPPASAAPVPGGAPPTVAADGSIRTPVGPPPLGADGRPLTQPALHGLHLLVSRLEDMNMEVDLAPSLGMVSPAAFREPAAAAGWAAGAGAFLRRMRPVLERAQLNRETLAVVNRVLGAAGLAPLSLGVRSFPLPGAGSDDDGPGVGAAGAGAQGGGNAAREAFDAQRRSQVQQAQAAPVGHLDSGGGGGGEEDGDEDEDYEDVYGPASEHSGEDWDDDVEDEGEGPPSLQSDDSAPRAPRAAPAVRAPRRGAGRQDGESRGPPPLHDAGSDDGSSASLPGLVSDGDASPPARRARTSGRVSGAAPAPAPAATWLDAVSNDDLLLVAGVALGELTRRLMGSLGLAAAPTPTNAALLRTADRLRALSSLEYGREDLLVRARAACCVCFHPVACACSPLRRRALRAWRPPPFALRPPVFFFFAPLSRRAFFSPLCGIFLLPPALPRSARSACCWATWPAWRPRRRSCRGTCSTLRPAWRRATWRCWGWRPSTSRWTVREGGARARSRPARPPSHPSVDLSVPPQPSIRGVGLSAA